MSVLEACIALLTACTLVITLVGLGAQFVLLPWLRTHLVVPVQETNRQVTVNRHVSDPPTLLDTVHTMRGEISDTKHDVSTAARMFEGHIAASEEDRGSLWEAVDRIETSLEGLTTRLEDAKTALHDKDNA